MKRSLIIFSLCCLIVSCQQENFYQLDSPPTTMTTRDSLLGRWNNIYTFTKDFSDSIFHTITDSTYQGHNSPFSYLQLNADSTYRYFYSTNTVPPIFGLGYSGKWRFDPAKRQLQMSTEMWSRDTGWTMTGIQPPPNNIIPLDFVAYLDSDSMVLYRRHIHRPPLQYRYYRMYDVYKRKR